MENVEENSIDVTKCQTSKEIKTVQETFKKPILIGKIGGFPKKLVSHKQESNVQEVRKNETDCPETQTSENTSNRTTQVEQINENETPTPYKEPIWSGLPVSDENDYVLEVLKSGTIIETINLMNRSFWTFGRLANCNILLQHPTISRYHAVLQYRVKNTETESSGFYIYDLGSTHGTFLNKNKLKPRVYVKVQVGHIMKFGCSTRSYILNGPQHDTEEESVLTVTELKERKAQQLRKREEDAIKAKQEQEDKRKREEDRGVDWGLGEDAEAEEDLSENPYAQTNNEDFYLDDPKKALRGFFEREGLDLEYDCTEQGMGQFMCKVELPLDDDVGRPIIAEVVHKGKKKEAVVQCALEACRILDRYGVLRQAVHESRKRKAKNWEENDYYDSDDDTFLDRTGTIEKKRALRMKAKLPQKAETYESLIEKEKSLSASISELEQQLTIVQSKLKPSGLSNDGEDTLDSFMKELQQPKPDKQTVSKIKLELSKLKTEHDNICQLINVARPVNLPSLVPHSAVPSTSKGLPIIGKRRNLQVKHNAGSLEKHISTKINEEENADDGDDTRGDVKDICQFKMEETVCTDNILENNVLNTELKDNEGLMSSCSSDEDNDPDRSDTIDIKAITFKKFEKILTKGLPPVADKHQEKLQKILKSLKKIAANEDRMHIDWKMFAAKKRKVMKLIADLKICEPNEKLEFKVSSELNRILNELNIMTEQKYKVIGKVKKMGNEIKNISQAIDKELKEEIVVESANVEGDSKRKIFKGNITNCQPGVSNVGSQSEMEDENTSEIKKNKNARRIQQRQERADMERQRGYVEDSMREDYSMWVPPCNQTGDGRTSLNEKYGY